MLADRASELLGRIVDLEVSIACLHRVRMVSSRGLAAERARDDSLRPRQAAVGTVGAHVTVGAAAEAFLRFAGHAPPWAEGQHHCVSVRGAC